MGEAEESSGLHQHQRLVPKLGDQQSATQRLCHVHGRHWYILLSTSHVGPWQIEEAQRDLWWDSYRRGSNPGMAGRR